MINGYYHGETRVDLDNRLKNKNISAGKIVAGCLVTELRFRMMSERVLWLTPANAEHANAKNLSQSNSSPKLPICIRFWSLSLGKQLSFHFCSTSANETTFFGLSWIEKVEKLGWEVIKTMSNLTCIICELFTCIYIIKFNNEGSLPVYSRLTIFPVYDQCLSVGMWMLCKV